MALPPIALSVLIGLAIVVGALQCFFGYRLFKFVLGLTGFLLGTALAGYTALLASGSALVALVAGLVGGLLGALLLVASYFIGVFLVGAALGCILGIVLLGLTAAGPQPVLLIALGAVGGIAAVVLQKVVIILATAFGGAYSVVMGSTCLATGASDPAAVERLCRSVGTQHSALLLCIVGLGVAGTIVQIRFMPHEQKSDG